jgi:Zn-dependent protease with chaperone function
MDSTPNDLVEFPCPKCGRTLVRFSGYPDFCESCNYGLSASKIGPSEPTKAQIRYQSAWHQTLRDFEKGSESRSVARLVGSVLAVPVLLFSLLMFALAFGLAIVLRRAGPLGILIPLFVALVGWNCRVRFPKKPSHAIEVSNLPALKDLLDRIAKVLNTREVELISLSPELNASMTSVGLRRIPLLTLGSPTIDLLSADQFLALLTHEMAHLASGDPSRGFLFGSALDTLARSRIGLGNASRLTRTPYGYIVLVPWMLIRLPLSAIEWILLTTTVRDSQRAEYRADFIAAQLAGPENAVALLENLEQEDLVAYARRKAAVQGVPTRPVLRELVASRPKQESLRLARLARTENLWPTEVTHPPTNLRIELLETHFGLLSPSFEDYDHEALLRDLEPLLNANY